MSDEYLEEIGKLISYQKENDSNWISFKIDMIVSLYNAYMELQEDYEELEQLLDIRNNRTLINKFNKEYDEEDKLNNPNRDYASITPDAEEIYKRYYELKENK